MSSYAMLAHFSLYRGKPLPHLETEANRIRGYCEGSLTPLFRLPSESNIDKVADDLSTFRNHIQIFHYSGHSDGADFFMGNAVGSGESLACSLGKCPNLKLVFLNACSTSDQVEKLFDQHVPIVIGTHYRVEDAVAAKFSTLFYKFLFWERLPILKAFQETLLSFRLHKAGMELIPGELLEDLATPKLRTQLNTLPTAGEWGIYFNTEDDPAKFELKDFVFETQPPPLPPALPTSLPPPSTGIRREHAFVCGRTDVHQTFSEHYENIRAKRKVSHFVLADERSKSLEGVCIGSLYEAITKHYSTSQPPDWLYLCNPLYENFREKVIKLSAAHNTYPLLLQHIFDRIPSAGNEKGTELAHLFSLPDMIQNRYAFIFLKVSEKDFPSIRNAMVEFIRQSVQYDMENPAPRVESLFFWHIHCDDKRFRFFRSSPQKKIHDLLTDNTGLEYLEDNPAESHLLFMHGLEPLARPRENDIEFWIGQYGFREPDLNDVMREYKKKNVIYLENTLIGKIDEKTKSKT